MGNPILRYVPSSGAVRPGDVLAGKYRVERVLGRGGMGVVVAATHVHLGERVALKLLLPGSPVTPSAFARFLREGRAAARMRSEHVARVHDAGVLDTGEPYLVLEYLDGVDLRSLLRARGRLPIDTAVVYVLQVCEALAEAHALGIVHRDLKPANLFLTRRADGTSIVKVIDFGISKITSPADPDSSASSLTAHDAAIGTPNYMAPEQMRSARAADARADIWSLGAVLHGLLTGASPFAGETLIEVYDRILKGAPSLRAAREDASPELEAIVHRCLRVDPAERYQSVAELAAALAELAPEAGRASAERAIRIAERPETASTPPPSDLDASGEVALPLASTELDPARASRETTVSVDVSCVGERLTTQATCDPSWAGRGKEDLPAPERSAAPSTRGEAIASSGQLPVAGRRPRKAVFAAVTAIVALAGAGLLLRGKHRGPVSGYIENSTTPPSASPSASTAPVLEPTATGPSPGPSAPLSPSTSVLAPATAAAPDTVASRTHVRAPTPARQAVSHREPFRMPVVVPPAAVGPAPTATPAPPTGPTAAVSAPPVTSATRPVVRNVPDLSDTPD